MRIAIGAVAMLIIVVALGSVMDLHVTAAASAAHASPQFATALLGLLAAACGGFIARRAHFAPIAMAVYTVFWALAIYYVHRFPLGLTYADLVSSNAVPIATSLSAVGIGALFGQNLAKALRKHAGAHHDSRSQS